MLSNKTHKGFTLIELLLVIGIIAILASIVIVAINPRKQLRMATSRQRQHNANEVRKAMYQYMIDTGIAPGDRGISTNASSPTQICRLGHSDGTCVNIDTVTPDYVACLPTDSLELNSDLSGFTVHETNGFFIVESTHDSPTADGQVVCEVPPIAIGSFIFPAALTSTINSVSNNYIATVNNMVAPSGPANIGPPNISTTSWAFDGIDDTVSIPYEDTFDFAEALTLSAWVYPTSFGTGDTVNSIVRKGEANPNMWQLAIEDGFATLMLEGSDGNNGVAQSPNLLALHTWQHIAGTWDGTTATVYVNGTAVDSNVYTGSNGGGLATDTRDVYIGGRTGSDYFSGNLHDVRMYDSALTETQIGQMVDGTL